MDTPVRTITSETFVANVAVSNSDTALVSSAPNAAGDAVHIWDLNSGQLLRTLTGQGGEPITSVALSPNGQLAVVSTEGPRAVLWDANTGRLLKSAPGPGVGADNRSRIAFSPDGQLILTSFLGDLIIFDTALNQKSKFRDVIPGATVVAIATSPEGRFMAGGCVRFDGGNDLAVFDLLSGQATLQVITNKGFGVTCLAWTGNNILTGSGSGAITLCDAQSGAVVSRPFPKHSQPVNAVAVSSDGRLALSGSDDATMKVMEVSTGKELRSFSMDGGVKAVAFASNSKFAVSGSGQSLKLWDLTGL